MINLIKMCIFVLCVSFCIGQNAYFQVSDIYEQQLISHERIKVVIDTANAYFPYVGQIGWRLIFSRFEMRDSDPQYEYAVYVLPARDYDLSQAFWFVRPAGLTGQWHMRIDAINSERAPVATSGEFIHLFTGQILTGSIPYVATDSYWTTALAFTNPDSTAIGVTIKAYTSDGTLARSWLLSIPANGTWSGYLSSYFVKSTFYGNLVIETSTTVSWIATVTTVDDPIGTLMQGICK